MKKFLILLLCAGLLGGLFSGCAVADNRVTINVYNWGQYIAEGDEGYMDVIAEFEKEYPNIRVNYVTFDSNETMYTKMSNGGITVDVIIPSDYMVGRLAEEGMLRPLNYGNIPNYDLYIDDAYKGRDYDPEEKYTVPYSWGTVGIIYNSKYVDEADVTGWELLWNEKYADKILMFDNSRDAFCITQCLLYGEAAADGEDYVNLTDPEKLLECAKKLEEQRPVVQQYIMDQVFDLMENEEAWIAPYYAGDYLTMAEENENLCFYLPEHQGFNWFVDAMCIPTCCENQYEAELFINFLCRPDIAGGNMDWVCYGTPSEAAKEYMDPEVVSDPVAYPDTAMLEEKGQSFKALPRATTRLMEALFMQVRNGIEIHLPD